MWTNKKNTEDLIIEEGPEKRKKYSVSKQNFKIYERALWKLTS